MIKPLRDNIVVRKEDKTEKTKGGIIIPDTARSFPDTGVVVCCGPGTTDNKGNFTAICVSPGDTVMFAKNRGHTVTVDDEDLTMIKDEDVLGILSTKSENE